MTEHRDQSTYERAAEKAEQDERSYFVVVTPIYGDLPGGDSGDVTSGPVLASFTIEHAGRGADAIGAIEAALEMVKTATWGGGNCEMPAALRIEAKLAGHD